MKKYVQQLIEDLNGLKRNAHSNLNAYFNGECVDEYLIIEDGEFKGIKVSDLIGLEFFMLPDLNYLNRNEIKELVKVLSNLWKAYGLDPMFAACVSDGVKYLQMKEYLNEFVFPTQNSMVDVEMCDFMPHACPYGEMCSSQNIAASKCCQKCNNSYKLSC